MSINKYSKATDNVYIRKVAELERKAAESRITQSIITTTSTALSASVNLTGSFQNLTSVTITPTQSAFFLVIAEFQIQANGAACANDVVECGIAFDPASPPTGGNDEKTCTLTNSASTQTITLSYGLGNLTPGVAVEVAMIARNTTASRGRIYGTSGVGAENASGLQVIYFAG